jgi:hypothetical protein
MSTFVGLALVFAACLGIYLASPNQRWLAKPVPAPLAWASGLTMCVTAWVCLVQGCQPLTASLMLYTALMLSGVVLPCSGALLTLLKKWWRNEQ